MDLTVHIGLPRAASTFLQERIFAQWPGLHYIGKTRNNYPDWLKWWHYGSALEFSRKSDWIRDSLESIADTGGKNVLSSEIIVNVQLLA